jgi:glyoxylase-like metal-dependent hydrolase (beta-lactamase superfamily II)
MQPAMLHQQSLVRTAVRSSQSKAVSRASRKLDMTCRATTSTERQPRRDNVGLEKENAVFVDHTCIDCDTCRWMDPQTYGRVGSMSAVVRQPETPDERRKALQALLACPTHSIQVKHQAPGEMTQAQRDFPLPTECEDVFHCGFASEDSFGATSWLVRRPEGNVMMDSPRYHPGLSKRLQAIGGVRYMVLSHRDDVCDHAKWAKALGCQRIIHKSEVNRRQGTDACEIQLEGSGPWKLQDGGEDIDIMFTPGHTPGCISMLYKPSKALFTGDHLMYSAQLGRLSIARRYNWDSVPRQLESVKALVEHDFLHIFPGHGRQLHFDSLDDRTQHIHELLVAEGAAGLP